MYVEGFFDEGLLEPIDGEFSGSGSNIVDPVSASDMDLRRMGLTVVNGGRV